MKKRRLILSVLMILSLSLTFVSVVLADTWERRTTLSVTETSGAARTGIIALVNDIEGDNLYDADWINQYATDTRLNESSTERKFLVCDDKLLFFVPSLTASQSRSYYFYTGYSPVVSSFPVIIGDGGYITTSDSASMELGNNFKIEYTGWLDVSYTQEQFPIVESTATSKETSSVTTHSVSLPSNIEAGDLLIFIFFGASPSGNPSVSSFPPTGWTSLGSGDDNNVDDCYAAAYRIADGNEGSTVTVTTGGFPGNCYSIHQSYRISNYLGVPDWAVTAQFDDSSTPDPPSNTVSWGADYDTLWMAGFVGAEVAIRTISSNPTNYGNQYFQTDATVEKMHIATTRREYTVATEDPGTYTLSDVIDGWAFTLGIQGTYNTQIVVKDSSFILENTASGELTATIESGTPKSAVATGLTSGACKVEVWADGTNIGIDIDDVNKDTTALSGESAPDNSNDWEIIIPYFDYYEHTVSSTLIVDYHPTEMISSSTVEDEEGTAQDGTITWGTTSDDITVNIGATTVYTETVAEGSGAEEGGVGMIPSPKEPDEWYPTGSGIGNFLGEIHPIFANAAADTGISTHTLYLMTFLFLSIAVGLGIALFTGSALIAVIGTGTFMGILVGTTVIGWWMVLVFALLGAGTLYLARTA